MAAVTAEGKFIELAHQIERHAVNALEQPWWYKVSAVLLGAANAVFGSLFGGAFLITAILAMIDWLEGRRTAEFLGKFDARVSTGGLNAKTTSLVLLIVVRMAEMWAHQAGIMDVIRVDQVLPDGAFATALCAFYAKDQWDSIHRHLATQGHPARFGSIASRMVDELLERWPRERRRRDEPVDVDRRRPDPREDGDDV